MMRYSKSFISLIIFFAGTLQSCQNHPIKLNESTVIAMQPFGKFSAVDIDSISGAITRMYAVKAKILPSKDLPKNAFTTQRSPRYRADSLLRYLSRTKTSDIDIIVGLTKKDISTSKRDKNGNIKSPEWKYKDFGIFGLGQVGGTSCVVSSYRLKKGTNTKGYYKRLTRITCHEVGHVLGLPHCPEKNCLMNDANERIKTIDQSTGKLCSSCWEQIH